MAESEMLQRRRSGDHVRGLLFIVIPRTEEHQELL